MTSPAFYPPTPFAIGVYQGSTPVQGGVQSNLSFPTPLAGSYGPPYTLVWYNNIAQPRRVVPAPPPQQGTDLLGQPVVRGFANMQWTYPLLHPDQWYFLYALFRLSRRALGLYTAKVRIQWPDPTTMQVQNASARWDAITAVSRDMPTFTQISLAFTHIGIDDTSVTGTWLANG